MTLDLSRLLINIHSLLKTQENSVIILKEDLLNWLKYLLRFNSKLFLLLFIKSTNLDFLNYLLQEYYFFKYQYSFTIPLKV